MHLAVTHTDRPLLHLLSSPMARPLAHPLHQYLLLLLVVPLPSWPLPPHLLSHEAAPSPLSNYPPRPNLHHHPSPPKSHSRAVHPTAPTAQQRIQHLVQLVGPDLVSPNEHSMHSRHHTPAQQTHPQPA